MSKLISLVFHPFSFLVLGAFIFFNTNTYINFSYPSNLKIMVYAVLIVNTMIIPVAFAGYLSSKGLISSIMMDDLNDRKLIYFFTFLLYLVSLFILSGFSVPGYIYKYALGGTMTIGALFVLALTDRKISAHLSAFGGLTGALVMLSIKLPTDFFILIIVIFLLSGIVASSRLQLKAHKEYEVYTGFLIGFLAQVFVFI